MCNFSKRLRECRGGHGEMCSVLLCKVRAQNKKSEERTGGAGYYKET